MKKTTYRFGLLGTVASMFSLNVPLFAAETDDSVTSSAKQSYVFRNYLKGDDITMQYDSGVVTLTGTVSDEFHQSLARETVASLPGVTDVNNRLEKNAAASSVNTDAWLIAKVRFALLCHQNLNATNIQVISKDGIVTLRGAATSSAQKNLTTEYIKDVGGVKKVKNEMTVATVTAKAGWEKMSQKMTNIGESIDDASITALVKTVLLYHRSTTALIITVETKDGVVKLEGKARNWSEKNLATKLVIDIHGVKMVFNNMTVEKIVSMTH